LKIGHGRLSAWQFAIFLAFFSRSFDIVVFMPNL